MSINFTALETSALAFTIALAWNDAVGKTIKKLIPVASCRSEVAQTILYAATVTLVVFIIVAVTNYIRKRSDYFVSNDSFKTESDPIIKLWAPVSEYS